MARWEQNNRRKRYRVWWRPSDGRWVCEFQDRGLRNQAQTVLWNAGDEFKAVAEVCRIYHCKPEEVETEKDRELRRRDGAVRMAAMFGEREEDANDE